MKLYDFFKKNNVNSTEIKVICNYLKTYKNMVIYNYDFEIDNNLFLELSTLIDDYRLKNFNYQPIKVEPVKSEPVVSKSIKPNYSKLKKYDFIGYIIK